MRLLILLFSAFVTAFTAGGGTARTAAGAEIAASAAGTIEATIVRRLRATHAMPVNDWLVRRPLPITRRAAAPLNRVSLYAGRLRL